ncbi:NADPH:quinone oxidoreductase family protein [Xanthobacteraceae bacterium Astr-EGSB]|uniref:NADPH:quinone oxidoreductase family protein n=1 Tax=Astrobacterium formosum TaxID=3069710 RepID=UPI0027AEEA02|nr:NADPH:quinone oxidoreductase family protein [Xanthobacteraceae bacterium Astr-EGSB]
MKAVLCTRWGSPDDLELAELPDPIAGRGEAVVKVAAAALNFFDTLIIAGKYQHKPAFPFSPASEFAGEVENIGANVIGLAPGDRVMGAIGWNAARERLVAPTDRLVKLPDGADLDRAAGLSVTYGTTLYALQNRAGLRAGETLAVLGAAGGTGLAAVEIGKLLGARVIACAGSDEKLDFARRHGADLGVNYDRDDLKTALRAATGGEGVDVVYDPIGGATGEAALRALRWAGRHLVIGFAAGDLPKFAMNVVLLKSLDILGVYWGGWAERNPAGYRADMAQIVKWFADGRLSARIHATYALADTAEAIRQIAGRKVMGKVIVKP